MLGKLIFKELGMKYEVRFPFSIFDSQLNTGPHQSEYKPLYSQGRHQRL